MAKTILLAGAPQASHKWRQEDLTVTALLPSFVQCIQEELHSTVFVSSAQVKDSSKPTAAPAPAWRSVALHNEHLPTGFTQPSPIASFSFPPQSPWQVKYDNTQYADNAYEPVEEGISFLTTTSTSFDPTSTINDADDGEELTQFLEQSFALHDGPHAATQASQLQQPGKPASKSRRSKLADPTSTLDTSTYGATIDTPAAAIPVAPAANHTRPATTVPNLPNLSTLSSLPKEPPLHSQNPQTPSISLIVGIISTSPTRSVTLRRTGKVVELLEVLVGDDTKAGFQVTFWLGEEGPRRANEADGGPGGGAGGELRSQALALRPGMVVALRNIALRAFRDVVSGQSLGRRGWGGTSITMIGDDVGVGGKGVGHGSAAEERMLQRIGRVREWTRRFVRPVGVKVVVSGDIVQEGERKGTKRPFGSIAVNELPEDETQEVVVRGCGM